MGDLGRVVHFVIASAVVVEQGPALGLRTSLIVYVESGERSDTRYSETSLPMRFSRICSSTYNEISSGDFAAISHVTMHDVSVTDSSSITKLDTGWGPKHQTSEFNM